MVVGVYGLATKEGKLGGMMKPYETVVVVGRSGQLHTKHPLRSSGVDYQVKLSVGGQPVSATVDTGSSMAIFSGDACSGCDRGKGRLTPGVGFQLVSNVAERIPYGSQWMVVNWYRTTLDKYSGVVVGIADKGSGGATSTLGLSLPMRGSSFSHYPILPQLGQQIVCFEFVGDENADGYMVLGSDPFKFDKWTHLYTPGELQKLTPGVPPAYFYTVKVDSIKTVEGHELLTRGPILCLLDTGTTGTMLPEGLHGHEGLGKGPLTLTFDGGAKMKINANTTYDKASDVLARLGFEPSSTMMLGNSWMRGLRCTLDVDSYRFSWE